MPAYFTIRGASNTLKLDKTTSQHPAFKKLEYKNFAVGGATVNIHDEKCCIYQGSQTPAKENEYFFFFAGMNGYQETIADYEKFFKDYTVALKRFARNKDAQKSRIYILLPLPRGLDVFGFLHTEQMRFAKRWGNSRENEGFKVIFTYAHLPEELRDPQNMFSKKDTKGIHFSEGVRNRLNHVIGKLMLDIESTHDLYNNKYIFNLE